MSWSKSVTENSFFWLYSYDEWNKCKDKKHSEKADTSTSVAMIILNTNFKESEIDFSLGWWDVSLVVVVVVFG